MKFKGQSICFFIFLTICTCGCEKKVVTEQKEGPEGLSAGSELVEILATAGSTDLVYWDSLGGPILIERGGMDFLPLPGNFGSLTFIQESGSNLYLPVLLLAKPIAKGKEIPSNIIAVCVYHRNNIQEQVIIAVPADPALRSVNCKDFVEFITQYDNVRNILQQWLLYYRPSQSIRFTGWRDQAYAGYLIAKMKNGESENNAPAE